MAKNANLSITHSQTVEVEWKVNDFLYLLKNVNHSLQSTCFMLSDAEWAIEIKPNGGTENSSGWVSLFLHKKSSPSAISVAYTIGIKKADDSVYQSLHGNDVFSKEECGRGTDKFVPRTILLDSKDILADGALRVFCSAHFVDDGTAARKVTVLQTSSSEGAHLLSELEVSQLKIKELEDKLSVEEEKKKSFITDSRNTIRTFENGSILLSSELNVSKIKIKKLENKLSEAEEKIESLTAQSLNEDKYIRQRKHLLTKLHNYSKKAMELDKLLSLANKRIVSLRADCRNKDQGLKSRDQTLTENFEELLLSGYLGDITIKVKDTEFLAHRCIVTARSPVFRAMFEADMMEKHGSVVNIDDCDPDSFKSFLLFLYSGQFNIVRGSNALKLCLIADKYGVNQLKKSCLECLAQRISVKYVCDAIYLASLYNEHELLTTATNFVIENMTNIVSTPKWLSFVTEHPTLANKLFVKMAKYKNISK